MINIVMKFTKLIDTLVLPQVQAELDNIKPTLNGRQPYETNIKEWLKPLVDLTDFYVYPMNGITECINWWQKNETRNVRMADGDYEWVDYNKVMTVGNSVTYVSCPSSIDGNYTEIPTDKPVVLDIAYAGCVPVKPITITDNVEKVFYSLSKPFGVSNIRTGWYFTRRPDAKLHALHVKAMYYNYCATQYAEHLINTYSIDYIHTQLKDIQHTVCAEYDLTPSDCVWLATSTDDKYKEYRRHKHTDVARICITKLIKERHEKR
jgi:hypothetical protein